MSGSPTTAAQKLPRAIESFSKKRRRLRSSGASVPAKECSVMFSFITNFRDPSSERRDEERKTDNEGDPGSDQAPKEERDSHRQTGGKIGGPWQMFRRERLPLRACNQ